ncbi:MAG: T9SS type A sorting domain-containing protein [Chitinophagales bacterium]|nr:T9SS type A sorting domain-containing protein [Chitinophagales bacterium]
MKIKLYLLTCLFTPFFFAQAQRNCSTHEHHEKMLLEDANYRTARQQIEGFNKTQRSFKTEKTNTTIIQIPVVIHVLYNKFEDSLTDDQILSQIEVLNKDYQLLNDEVNSIPDEFTPVASGSNFRFVLATRKPDGVATNGIERKFTNKISFSDNNDMKYSLRGGADAWDATQYLNIWICRLNNNLLGYAQLPGGAAATDGVVINPIAFGTLGTAKYPYNKGRTATHEVGHWLNLAHIWGDKTDCKGDDLVEDTPPQSMPTYGMPKKQPSSCGHNSMYMNFMDYTDDAGMAMFTTGQVARMEKLFAEGGFRHSIISSKGLLLPDGKTATDNNIVNNECNSENSNDIRGKAKQLKGISLAYGKIDKSGKSEWFEFSNNKVQSNIYITLSELTADFDIALYNANGLLLTRSRRSGDKPEALKWNNAEVGNYYVRVYGYQGATSTNCFALQTQLSKVAFKTNEEEVLVNETEKPEDIKVLQSKVYPNPSSYAANFDVNLEEEGEVNIAIYDMVGAKIKSYNFNSLSGFNSLNIEFGDIQSGVYNLVAQSGDAKFKQRLIVSR